MSVEIDWPAVERHIGNAVEEMSKGQEPSPIVNEFVAIIECIDVETGRPVLSIVTLGADGEPLPPWRMLGLIAGAEIHAAQTYARDDDD